MRDLLHLVNAALAAAETARAYVHDAQPPREGTWGEKAPRDFVTDIDRTSERMIADRLIAAVPDSVVVGEEFSPDVGLNAPISWLVDPLDGTINFLHRYPQYAISIAAIVDREPVVGVVVDIGRGVTYHAWRGGGAWAGKERLSVSALDAIDLALIGTGFPFKRLDEMPRFQRQLAVVLAATAGVRRAGAAALDLADVACGRFDGFWEIELAPWDIAAGVVLIREAGGIVTSLDGEVQLHDRGSVVAGNPTIHAQLMRLLADHE